MKTTILNILPGLLINFLTLPALSPNDKSLCFLFSENRSRHLTCDKLCLVNKRKKNVSKEKN